MEGPRKHKGGGVVGRPTGTWQGGFILARNHSSSKLTLTLTTHTS